MPSICVAVRREHLPHIPACLARGRAVTLYTRCRCRLGPLPRASRLSLLPAATEGQVPGKLRLPRDAQQQDALASCGYGHGRLRVPLRCDTRCVHAWRPNSAESGATGGKVPHQNRACRYLPLRRRTRPVTLHAHWSKSKCWAHHALACRLYDAASRIRLPYLATEHCCCRLIDCAFAPQHFRAARRASLPGTIRQRGAISRTTCLCLRGGGGWRRVRGATRHRVRKRMVRLPSDGTCTGRCTMRETRRGLLLHGVRRM